MMDSVFVFTRYLPNASDPHIVQTITVFAPNLDVARQVLASDLDRMRDGTSEDELALRDQPSWKVYAVELTEPKVITFAIT